MEIGENIKEQRKKLGLTQEQLAIKSGISKNAIWNYENNKRQPTIQMINKIAEALNTSITSIIGIDESEINEIFNLAGVFGIPLEYLTDEAKGKNLYKYNLGKLFKSISIEEIINTLKDYSEDIQNAVCSIWYESLLNLFPIGVFKKEHINAKYIDILHLENMFSEYYAQFQLDLSSLKFSEDSTKCDDANELLNDCIPKILEIRTNFTNNISSLIDKTIIRCLSDEQKILFINEITKYNAKNKRVKIEIV